MKVIVILSNRKMFCHNPEYEHTTFAETFKFLPANAKKTKRLTDEIINFFMNVSSLTVSSLLGESIAKVCKSTICNLLKKDAPIIHREAFSMVCIDDFAIRKRESYGTIMVDIETHRVIDLTPSREGKDVVEWLKTYPNLNVISRDGSITYRNAITTAHPKAVQVSDRFHILKNLTSYCKKYFMKSFKVRIAVDMPEKPQVDVAVTTDLAVKNKNLTLEQKSDQAISMLAKSFSKTQLCRQLNMDSRTLEKLIGMSEEERNQYVKSSSELSHNQKVLKKQDLVNAVKIMHDENYSIRLISQELQLSRQTVTRYLDEGVNAIHGNYNVKRNSILTPYLNEINYLIDKGSTSSVIEAEIRQKGYTGGSSTLKNYRANIKRLISTTYNAHKTAPEPTELVERKLLIRLLFKPLDKIKGQITNV